MDPSPTSPTNSKNSWHGLPVEMQLAIVDVLAWDDIKSFSIVDQQTYKLCVPSLFKNVKLNSFDNLRCFLDNVPPSYYHYIQQLDLCTKIIDIQGFAATPRTDAVATLLKACPRLKELALRIAGSLDRALIPCFSYFHNLKRLQISNCGEEDQTPLSERLVVSIAASVTGLEELSLDRISRSTMHAAELVGVYPYVPLVYGDEDIPDHPLLGSDLSLPSLLRLPSLRKLIIRNTHLGDPLWATTPVACRLEVLDLGSCYYENDDVNRVCTERIMAAVGPTVDEFSLTTAVSDAIFSKSSVTPLQRLRKLHISPFFPVERVVDTMSNLAGSPIESLSMQCYEEDVVDTCSALEEFLSLRVERGPDFYDRLTRIDVSITAGSGSSMCPEEISERTEAAKRLQNFCRDLSLVSEVEEESPHIPVLDTRHPPNLFTADDDIPCDRCIMMGA